MIRRVLTLLVLIAVVLFAAVFASWNTDVITVDFLFARVELPQSVVIIGALVIGVLVGLLAASLVVLRIAAERRRLRRALRTAEAEISSLRSLPLQNAE